MFRIHIFFFSVLSLYGAAKRPNILFAFADDWGQQAGIYAAVLGKGGINDLAKTPNFDNLANGGVLFKNAFVNAPSCTPCRSSLLSGRNFWETGRGAILIGAEWDEQIPTWPLLLQNLAIIWDIPTRYGHPVARVMLELEDMRISMEGGGSTGFHNMFRAGLEKWRVHRRSIKSMRSR